MWWGCKAQWWWPVRMVSPRRRKIHAELARLLANPAFQAAVMDGVRSDLRSREHELVRLVFSRVPVE
ncbi:hypothetical protein BKD26_34365 [Streptomyces sp. CB03238]|nr:hypothetical protein BKD26_34365 [Streptomyces sp. CB03238]